MEWCTLSADIVYQIFFGKEPQKLDTVKFSWYLEQTQVHVMHRETKYIYYSACKSGLEGSSDQYDCSEQIVCW